MTPLPEGASELFGLPPGEFVAKRNALVKELKKAKRTDDAAAVAALRRPSVADHAVNVAARADPERAQRWSVAVIAVAEAQTAAIGGGAAGALRETTVALRAETAELATAAVAAIGDEAKRNDILGALRAATTRPGAVLVAAGILGAADPEDELFAGAVEPIASASASASASAGEAASASASVGEAAPVSVSQRRSSKATPPQATSRSAPPAAARAPAAPAPRPTAERGTKTGARLTPERTPGHATQRRETARAEAAARRVAATARAAARVAAADVAASTARDAADAARHAVEMARDGLREAESVQLTTQRGLKRALAESAAARAAATRAARE